MKKLECEGKEFCEGLFFCFEEGNERMKISSNDLVQKKARVFLEKTGG